MLNLVNGVLPIKQQYELTQLLKEPSNIFEDYKL